MNGNLILPGNKSNVINNSTAFTNNIQLVPTFKTNFQIQNPTRAFESNLWGRITTEMGGQFFKIVKNSDRIITGQTDDDYDYL